MIWLIIYLIGIVITIGMTWASCRIINKKPEFAKYKDVLKKYEWIFYVVFGIFWPLLLIYSICMAPYKTYKMMKE